MPNEFELISHGRFPELSVLLVKLRSRRPHIHRELELGLILDGALTLHEGERAWSLNRGDLYLINSMEAHEFIASGDETMVLAVQILPRLLESFLPNAPMRRYRTEPPLANHHPSLCPPLRDCLLDLARNYYSSAPGTGMECCYLTARALYLLEHEIPVEVLSRQNYDSLRRKTERIVSITDYIDQNFQRKLLLEEIADRQGLTMTHVSHLFKDTLGVSFQTYLKEKRFEFASFLLDATNKSVLDVSLESGFSDLRYLTRVFQEKLGCTPTEYRRRRPARPPGQTSDGGNLQEILSDAEAAEQLSTFSARICT